MGNCLYNGHGPLPDIYTVYTPELQKEKPYAFMTSCWWPSTNYTLYIAREIQYRQLDSGYFIAVIDCESYTCFQEHESAEWAIPSQYDDVNICVATDVKWANFNVLNEDGTLYLAASDLVPPFIKRRYLNECDTNSRIGGKHD